MRFVAQTLFLFTAFASAQRPLARTPRKPKERLAFVLIVARHGVRPPLRDNAFLNTFSAEPWPMWEVPLGQLTPHGAEALEQLGRFMRVDSARTGVLPATGCPSPASIYLYSDTDQRNLDSTRATFHALASGCAALPVHTFIPNAGRDPIFVPVPGSFRSPPPEPALAAMLAAMGNDPETALSEKDTPELLELAHVLAPDAAHRPASPILDQPIAAGIYDDSGHGIFLRGPLPSSSSLSEDILLEYVDNKPMAEVGWGRADEATIRRLNRISVKSFALSGRTPVIARTMASNITSHILDTLDQAATHRPVAGAFGTPAARMVYVSAHDSTMSAMGGLLGLHWLSDGRTDDTPPDSQIVFQLWQRAGVKTYTLRMEFVAQTLGQLRSASPLTLASPPDRSPITPTGCSAGSDCAYAVFGKAARQRIDPAYVKPELQIVEAPASATTPEQPAKY